MKTITSFSKAIFVSMILLSGIGMPTIAVGAGDYLCEVMSLKGTASVFSQSETRKPLAEGSLLKAGDRIDVDENSHVDLAFDKRWNNVTRLTGPTKIGIRSVYPIGLSLDRGDVLAKLSKLPKNSTFEIETPTAIAAVRGSEFRTVVDDGVTEIFNLHDSEVEVFGKNLEGEIDRESTTLDKDEKTEVKTLGEDPETPEKMTEEEIREHKADSADLSQEVKEVVEEGRLAEIQDLEGVEKEYQEDLEKRLEDFKDGSSALSDEKEGAPSDEYQDLTGQALETLPLEEIAGNIDEKIEGIESQNEADIDKQLNDAFKESDSAGGTSDGDEHIQGLGV